MKGYVTSSDAAFEKELKMAVERETAGHNEYNSLYSSEEHEVMSVLCVSVCCRVLQGVAVCCSVLQCVAVCCGVFNARQPGTMNIQSVYSSEVMCILCVAVCCSVLQCVAVCCSVSRYVLNEYSSERRVS